MRNFKQEKIDRLTNDYAEYLHEFSNKDLKLIVEWNVFTFREARHLEGEYDKRR